MSDLVTLILNSDGLEEAYPTTVDRLMDFLNESNFVRIGKWDQIKTELNGDTSMVMPFDPSQPPFIPPSDLAMSISVDAFEKMNNTIATLTRILEFNNEINKS